MLKKLKLKIHVQIIKNIYKNLDNNRKKDLFYLGILIILMTVFELLSVIGLIPILLIVISPTDVIDSNYTRYSFVQYLKYNYTNTEIILLFLILITLTGLLRLLIFKKQTILLYSIGNDLSKYLIKKLFALSYQNFNYNDSSDITSLLTTKIDTLITNYFIPMLQIISNSLILITFIIFISIFLINSGVMLFGIIITVIIYILIYTKNKSKINEISKIINNEQSNTIKQIKISIDNIRELILYDMKSLSINNYLKSQNLLRISIARLSIMNGSSKYILELLFFTVILLIILYNIMTNNNLYELILILGVLIYSFQRSMPLINQLYSGFVSISGCSEICNNILKYINLSSEEKKSNIKIKFNNILNFKNITFKYGEKIILNNLNLTIQKGSFIAITGKTGSGKSTFMDIILGLKFPYSGEIRVDDVLLNSLYNERSWMNQIAHVSQNPYIYDSSIYENITLNKDKIISNKYTKAINTVKLNDILITSEDHFEIRTGEYGKNLSGGQKQKIAIARALYKDSEILLLDESTSALNKEDAIEIIDNIRKNYKNITLIHISHSIWMDKQYDYIYILNKHKLI